MKVFEAVAVVAVGVVAAVFAGAAAVVAVMVCSAFVAVHSGVMVLASIKERS